jgi:phosphatidylglycerol lysyltransferase
MLGLGDPAGSVTDRISAIWNLRDLALQEGLDPAVYRAGPELLKVYEDLGLSPLPLGPDGLLLPDTADPSRASEYLCCVAERDLALLAPSLPEIRGLPLQQAAE